MTNEELDEARAKEALRIWTASGTSYGKTLAIIAARLARENWTPPEPVDPDVEAYWGWHKSVNPTGGLIVNVADAYLAGARMAREQERERGRALVEFVEDHSRRLDGVGARAHDILAKYRGEA